MNQPSDSQESQESRLYPLLAAVKDGSVESQNQLMGQLRLYFHLMAQYELSPEMQNKIGQSDIVQQSCIRVLEGRDQFRGTSEGELRNWLKRILVNEVKQTGRGMRARKRDMRREISMDDSRLGIGPVDSMATPRTNALAGERAASVRNAMQKLPEEYQQVIRMRSWQQLTFPQIADQIGKSLNATEKLWYRAIQRLRKELSDEEQSR